MAVEMQGKVGPIYAADATIADPRMTRDGALATQDLHGRYNEAVLRGNVWTLATANAGVTVAAANTIGQAAPTPIVGIYNPVGSGKVCAVWRVAALWNSGTPAAGGLVWGVFASPAGITAAGGNGAINAGTLAVGGSTAKTFTGAAMTGGGTMSILRFLGGPFAIAIAATSVGTWTFEETAGEIIVPAGGALALLASGAGTSPIINASMTWEEYTP